MTTSGNPTVRWTVEPGDRSTVVHVGGEIDLATHAEFDKAVRAGMDSGAPVVILNLGEVTFLGSVGLRVLVQANHETQQTGRTLRVVHGTAIVRRIIEVTGLEQVLSLYPTLQQAQST
ncbi:STAS domain-containing protein [Actinocrispum wychmicini]|uniref:Anti-sigma factor antagonist n=1 Tax=Actinocrispum wychmicini TaxID=1213861 RepID=A0A4R2ILH0_9PSEU|nr:STAS domain-containing protein [Actinocrispum wychmicini]TCO45352.1 anti-sigma B factor antagonist [Actinocrispum wychmicini]